MWGSLLSALLSDVPTSFQYTIGQPVESKTVGGLFKLVNAQHKSNKHDHVSAFVYERKSNNAFDEAQRIMKLAKSLRHPYIVSVRDVLETNSGNLYIVSECVEPLTNYLVKSDNNRHVARETAVWNLKCVSEALEFLHEANIIHRSICLETIFVCAEGQWKLGIPEMGWDLNSGRPDPISSSANPLKLLYESDNHYTVQPLPVVVNTQAADRYMLGCMLAAFWSLCMSRQSIGKGSTSTFPPLMSVKWSLQTNKSWTSCVLGSYIKALTENPDRMPDGSELWQEDIHVPVMKFFQNYALQNSWDLEKFFESTFPKALNSSKISNPKVRALVYLPKLSKILVPQEFGLVTALPQHIRPQALRIYAKLLQDCSQISKDAFDLVAWRTLNLLYHDPERATRFMLLLSIESYANHLDATQIQQIFDEVLAGLIDSSQELRDVTLRGLTVLLPKLLEAGLGGSVDKALRVISGMIQTDRIPAIRTNAAVCLSKIAILLKSREVHSRISPGLKTATCDSFPPCRLAGLEGLRRIVQHIPQYELANTYLPATCPRLVDDDEQCRKAAHRFVTDAVKILAGEPGSISPSATPQSLHGAVQNSPSNAVKAYENANANSSSQNETPSETPNAISFQTPQEYSVRTDGDKLSDKQLEDPLSEEPTPLISNKVRQTLQSEVATIPPSRRSTAEVPAVTQPDPSAKFWQEVNSNNELKPVIKKSLGAARRTNLNRNAV